jgi:hypothetical protein
MFVLTFRFGKKKELFDVVECVMYFNGGMGEPQVI